jgi:hypothetical protein
MSTLTTFPVAGANSPVDGYIGIGGQDSTLSTILSANGNTAANIDAGNTLPWLQASATTNQFQSIYYGIYLFDTSSLGSSANITSATFSLFSTAGAGLSTGLGTCPIHVAGAVVANSASLAGGDYQNTPHVSFGSVSWATATQPSQYIDWTLNASGIANINKTGISQFSTQLEWEINNNFTGTWASSAVTRGDFYFADQTGTANDPKLVVNYTVGGDNIITTFYLRTLS